MRYAITFLVSIALPLVAIADEAREMRRQLDAECAQAREEFIAPIRQQKIEQCIVEDGYERDRCERELRQYGHAGHPRLGLELPECIKSHEANRNSAR
jgi:hypothetical protein